MIKLLILVAAFPLGILAGHIGARMSDEAVTLVFGVMVGVILFVPVALGLLRVVTRPQVVERVVYVDRMEGEIVERVEQLEAGL